MSVEEYLRLAPEIRPIIEEIRRQKVAGERLRPSTSLIDRARILTAETRRKLLDKIAALVDENYAGRSEMCPSMVTAKPAMRGRLKTGHVKWPKTGVVLPCRSEFGKAGFGRAVTC